jgi:peptide subunit release factor 1 (eRF1)
MFEALGDHPTGAIAFLGERANLVVSPPFPPPAAPLTRGYITRPLRDLLTAPRTLGVILIRLGGYSVGVYRDGRFVDTKTGGRFVKNRQRKGGQSQRRFERIRE